ncbi:MAG TPA: hypothetical protein VLC09_20080 [Polyangiaceae bacterium]|nr:hypothetical protein [Polyangiaceae bacterium]
MALTFAFIGNRSDVGQLLPAAHRELLVQSALPGQANQGLAWGVGFFRTDEVLLRRRPAESRSPFYLADELNELRCHSLLAHICHARSGALRTETTPPLRFGHMLFACEGAAPHLGVLRESLTSSLPQFLRSHLKGDTFTELACSLFLAELPLPELERTWARPALPVSGTLSPGAMRDALRRAFTKLDGFTEAHGVERFVGTMWVNTGENVLVAHRRGPVGVRVFQGGNELSQMVKTDSTAPASLGLSHFTTLIGGVASLPSGWESIPDDTILTADRAQAPTFEALG